MSKTNMAIVVFLLIPVFLIGSVWAFDPSTLPEPEDPSFYNPNQISEEPIEPSNPTNIVIRESAIYDAPHSDDEEPIAHFAGLIYWEELAGTPLGFFINTSKVIDVEFIDFETKDPLTITEQSCVATVPFTPACVNDLGDRYLIVPKGRSFMYEIDSYYEPDIVEDTGFIVVFNSQSVDFSIDIEGEPAYARTDYANTIVLPKGAGLVSHAPIDDGFLGLDFTQDGRVVLKWEYLNRQMDSKHEPLLISVTYKFDPLFLAFTEQVYKNQEEQRERQEEINRLNLIRQSFAVMATLAIVLSIFSVFFAYLLARRKFETDLKRAQELPRREVSDIEADPPLKVPIRSMFLSAMIIVPMLFSPVMVADGQIMESDRVQWDATYDLRRDLTLTETIHMVLPVAKDYIYIYTDTSVSELNVYNEFGSLNYEVEENRYRVNNPGTEFTYDLDRPYEVHNNSNMLVWLDRAWLEFSKDQVGEDGDPFYNVDMTYTVKLPENAFLYSASPSDLTESREKINNRYQVTFKDTNRQMDAFHDVFETQVTFSFIGIIEALENLDSDFVQVKAEEQDLESLVRVAAQEVLIFAILGLIAPLISFIIAYWVFRRRYQKMIDRAEKEQEEKIFVEGPQIQALSAATGSEASQRLTDAFMGHYFRAVEFLSKLLETDVSRYQSTQILELFQRSKHKIDTQLLMEVLSLGQSVNPEDSIGYEQLSELARAVDELIESTNGDDL